MKHKRLTSEDAFRRMVDKVRRLSAIPRRMRSTTQQRDLEAMFHATVALREISGCWPRDEMLYTTCPDECELLSGLEAKEFGR